MNTDINVKSNGTGNFKVERPLIAADITDGTDVHQVV